MNETKKKILIVDDDRLLAESLEKLFEGGEFETMMLFAGDDVCSTVMSWKPDVILLDVMLPGKNGIEIVKEMCDHDKGVCKRIVVMTTLNDSAILAKALELGVTSYVQKNTATPESVVELAKKIISN